MGEAKRRKLAGDYPEPSPTPAYVPLAPPPLTPEEEAAADWLCRWMTERYGAGKAAGDNPDITEAEQAARDEAGAAPVADEAAGAKRKAFSRATLRELAPERPTKQRRWAQRRGG